MERDGGGAPGRCERMQVAYDRQCVMATKDKCGNTGKPTTFNPHYTQGGIPLCTWARSGNAMACATNTCMLRKTPQDCMLGSKESPCRWVPGQGCRRDAAVTMERLRRQQAANARPRQRATACSASPLRDVCHRSWMTVRDASFRPHVPCADFASVDACPTSRGCSTICADGAPCCDCEGQSDCRHDTSETPWSRSMELVGGDGQTVVVDPAAAAVVSPPRGHGMALYAEACCEPMDAGTCDPETEPGNCAARPECAYDATATPPCQPAVRGDCR